MDFFRILYLIKQFELVVVKSEVIIFLYGGLKNFKMRKNFIFAVNFFFQRFYTYTTLFSGVNEFKQQKIFRTSGGQNESPNRNITKKRN